MTRKAETKNRFSAGIVRMESKLVSDRREVGDLAARGDTCPSGQVIRLNLATWTGSEKTGGGVISGAERPGTSVASLVSRTQTSRQGETW